MVGLDVKDFNTHTELKNRFFRNIKHVNIVVYMPPILNIYPQIININIHNFRYHRLLMSIFYEYIHILNDMYELYVYINNIYVCIDEMH